MQRNLVNDFECLSVSPDGHEPPILIRGVDMDGGNHPILLSYSAATGTCYYLNKAGACGRTNWEPHEVQKDE